MSKSKKMTKAQAAAARWDTYDEVDEEQRRAAAEESARKALRTRSIGLIVAIICLAIIIVAVIYGQFATGCTPFMLR